MTTMIAEVYDALLAAGSPEDKARKAAEALAGYEAHEQRLGRIETDIAELKHDFAELKRDVFLLKWMVGVVVAFQIAIFVKLFLH